MPNVNVRGRDFTAPAVTDVGNVTGDINIHMRDHSGGEPVVTLSKTATIVIVCTPNGEDIAQANGVVTFRMPRAMTLTGVKASLTVAATGANFVVDINKNGTTILSTKLSIDAGEKTSTTATAAVISDTALADDDEITIDVDQIGSTVAGQELKVTLIGTTA